MDVLVGVDADDDIHVRCMLQQGPSPLVLAGPDAHEGGQDCSGTSSSGSYQVTRPGIGGRRPAGRQINARTRGQS
jgi:hypothetical protein